MRVAEKSIKDHPVISEFLKSVESQTMYSASSFFPVNQENGVEEDLDRLLEKQKGCYMFDDPKHGISRDILFGIGMKGRNFLLLLFFFFILCGQEAMIKIYEKNILLLHSLWIFLDWLLLLSFCSKW